MSALSCWCKVMDETSVSTKNGSPALGRWHAVLGSGTYCWTGCLWMGTGAAGTHGGMFPELRGRCLFRPFESVMTPSPTMGGNTVKVLRAKYESCSTQEKKMECPPGEKSFRDLQCEMHNFRDHHGNLKVWLPKYSGVSPRDRCKLMCQERGGSEFKVFQTKVVDGTLCGPDSLSVCVQGQCFKAGCDHILNSTKKLDKCGVCGGDGSSCRKITGSLSKCKYDAQYYFCVSAPTNTWIHK
ncbi:unnamed protein product [Ranitomeya imitator]|uniref:ADAMTS/ADAMTS-like cysteine-rich domain-containing protein n=1 Tax=Ranitomeya imitator TaxID=111125 RepID=A0ABN9MJL8_9NEOB|nr:unnamed protein product [Ranitomeya imitator]